MRTIGLAYNPFGDNGDFVAVFVTGNWTSATGRRHAPLRRRQRAGARWRSTGKAMITQPSPNLVRDAKKLGAMAVGVTLEAGRHRIRYIHAQSGPRVLAELGKMVGERAEPLGPEDFAHDEFAKLGSRPPHRTIARPSRRV